MRMIGTPLVYVGPSLSRDLVQQAYPGCIVRPPIRRGDLYRDRMLRGSVFLILDGVFFQDQAISPREVLDVVADDALVVGAASMGALRAAECWPGGMRGVGSIYRLFRSGALSSDDEVAVAFSTASSSVALVNVRYAASRVVKEGGLKAAEARQLVQVATEMFYEDRHWPLLLRAAGLADRPKLEAALSAHDLKASDAKRALARLRRWLREAPSLLERPRTSTRPFTPSEASRERPHDAYASAAQSLASDLRLPLARWLFASGRYLRHAGALIAARQAQPRSSPRAARRAVPAGAGAPARDLGSTDSERANTSLASTRAALIQSAYESADAALAEHDVANTAKTRAAYVAIATRPALANALLRDFAEAERAYVDLVWLTLSLSDELDAELFRFHAQRTAAARIGSAKPTAFDRHLAELQIATAHACQSWAALVETLADCPKAQVLVMEHGETAARAKAATRANLAPGPR